ncbi:HIT family protein [Lentzea sp. HUAS12]|uniref:HIT family protein n=1 Tax=Lentzea sp. HUAS12 TaxID=2951806 RepID=UPI00209F5287|nr:HIT domain-containing protein [Lentzea sp. HUAS12]USX56222.1 HIT domain-containing protein [Lentzea sp. HUAS12]
MPTRLLRETADFLAIADISPLVVGHIIVVPRRHLLSFGAIPDVHRPQLGTLVADLSATLIEHVGVPVLLEHGTDSASDGGGCVSHAHLHLVPAALDWREPLARYRLTEVSSLDELSYWAERDRPYIYAGAPSGAGLVADELIDIPKQYLRIEIARQLGLPGRVWDWRQHILSDNLTETVALFQSREGAVQ